MCDLDGDTAGGVAGEDSPEVAENFYFMFDFPWNCTHSQVLCSCLVLIVQNFPSQSAMHNCGLTVCKISQNRMEYCPLLSDGCNEKHSAVSSVLITTAASRSAALNLTCISVQGYLGLSPDPITHLIITNTLRDKIV